MPRSELWQVYHANGSTLSGAGMQPAAFTDDDIMAAAHVWVWRRRFGGEVEVLAQKRASTKVTWPGYYDISTAGHIDLGETSIDGAVREAREEIGLQVDPERLLYVFSLRTPLVPNEIDHVYLYEAADDFQPMFSDGEVESAEWFTVDELRIRFASPDAYRFVDQGEGYFSLIIAQFEKL